MKLVAFGDSFTHGLIKVPYRTNYKESHELSFVRHISDASDHITSYENHAHPGISNGVIAWTVYKYVVENDVSDCIFFIGWTTGTRAHRWDNDLSSYVNSNFAQKGFTRGWPLKNDSCEAFENETLILGINGLLEKLNVPYVMIQAFDDIKSMPMRHTGSVNQTKSMLSDLHLPNWIEHPKKNNMLVDIMHGHWLDKDDYANKNLYHDRYAIKNQYIAGCGHPSHEGHKLIAETLLPYINNAII